MYCVQPLVMVQLQSDMAICVRARVVDVLMRAASLTLLVALVPWCRSGVDAATALQVDLRLLLFESSLSGAYSVTFLGSWHGMRNLAIRPVQHTLMLLRWRVLLLSVGAAHMHQH